MKARTKTVVLRLAGIGLAYVLYVFWPELPGVIRTLGHRPFGVLHNKYYVDEAYDAVIVRPLHRTGRFCYGVDCYFIDGLIWLVTAVPRGLGFMLSGLQKGIDGGLGVGGVEH